MTETNIKFTSEILRNGICTKRLIENIKISCLMFFQLLPGDCRVSIGNISYDIESKKPVIALLLRLFDSILKHKIENTVKISFSSSFVLFRNGKVVQNYEVRNFVCIFHSNNITFSAALVQILVILGCHD